MRQFIVLSTVFFIVILIGCFQRHPAATPSFDLDVFISLSIGDPDMRPIQSHSVIPIDRGEGCRVLQTICRKLFAYKCIRTPRHTM